MCWRLAIRIVFTGMLVTGAAEYSSNGQTCGAPGTAVQVLGLGGPELQDKRASSSYLMGENGQARAILSQIHIHGYNSHE